MRRVIVIGTSGSGKTTVAAKLAERLGVRCVELDALSWGLNWQSVPAEEFRARVTQVVVEDAWVIDGNYSAVREITWPRADTIVWLDLPRRVVMWQVITRTAGRILRREVLWSGNRESIRTAFSRDSIVLWAWTTYDRRHRDYPQQFAAHPHVAMIRLRSTSEVRRFLDGISPLGAGPMA